MPVNLIYDQTMPPNMFYKPPTPPNVVQHVSIANEKAENQPKKNGKKSFLSPGIAAFIQKTYNMICQCDENIACWDESGETFIIKDPRRLSITHIPRYFDHNNFSSFARQLNFYGFRKIINTDTYVHHVRFYHEYFCKGRPDLLCRIKRSTNTNDGAHGKRNKEVDALKKTVLNLEEKFLKVSSNFERQMNEMMSILKRSRNCPCTCEAHHSEHQSEQHAEHHSEQQLESHSEQHSDYHSERPLKKRKIHDLVLEDLEEFVR